MLFTRSKGSDLDARREQCESMGSRLDDYKLITISRLALHDQPCVLYGGTAPFGLREQGKGMIWIIWLGNIICMELLMDGEMRGSEEVMRWFNLV